jgi:hypothetical protein
MNGRVSLCFMSYIAHYLAAPYYHKNSIKHKISIIKMFVSHMVYVLKLFRSLHRCYVECVLYFPTHQKNFATYKYANCIAKKWSMDPDIAITEDRQVTSVSCKDQIHGVH